MQLHPLEQMIYEKQLSKAIDKALNKAIQPISHVARPKANRDLMLIKDYFGFNSNPTTIVAVAKQYGISNYRAGCVIHKLYRRLRHPDLSRPLREFLN